MCKMFRTKQQIDKHIASILVNIKDEREKNNRGFQFARMYFDAKEYDSALRYLEAFLSTRDNFPPAHKLMAEVFEAKGNVKQALAAFKKTYQLDDTQRDVLIKICEMCTQVEQDPGQIKYWTEKAESEIPNHEIVFRLKEAVIRNIKDNGSSSAAASEELETLLTSELKKRPQQYKLRVSLLQLYLKKNCQARALEHVLQVEKLLPHPRCVMWYKCILEVAQAYQQTSGATLNGEFYQLLLHTLNELIHMASEGVDNIRLADALYYLHLFDQAILCTEKMSSDTDVWRVYFTEMQGQLFYHCATLLLKKAQQERLGWRDATLQAAACYLVSLTIKPPSLQSAWYQQAQQEDKLLLHHMFKMSCWRFSQAGHVVRYFSASPQSNWVLQIQQDVCTNDTKVRIGQTLFTLKEMRDSRDSSYLLRNNIFTTANLDLPRDSVLRDYDDVAHKVYPEDLQRLVWLALQQFSVKDSTQPNYGFKIFPGLQYGVLKLDSSTPESLSVLDTEVFLLACVRLAAVRQHEVRLQTKEEDEPAVLPLALCRGLVTQEQAGWWRSVCHLQQRNPTDDLSLARLTVERGLEAVRLQGSHGLDVKLVTHVARTLQERLGEVKGQAQSVLDLANSVASVEAWVRLYWRGAIDLVRRQLRGQTQGPSKGRFFEAFTDVPTEQELLEIQEEASYNLALIHADNNETEESLQLLDSVSSPEGSYQQAQIYRKLALKEMGELSADELAGDDKEQVVALLIKAKDYLYTTMDRIRSDRTHPLNGDIADQLDLVESLLARLDANTIPGLADLELGTGEKADTECTRSDIYQTLTRPVTPGILDTTAVSNGVSNAEFEGKNKPWLHQVHQLASSTPRRCAPSPAPNTPLTRYLRDQVPSRSATVAHVSYQGHHSVTVGASPDLTGGHKRLRPTPERLEAQMMNFRHTQDNIIKTLLDELKEQRINIQSHQEKIHSAEADKLRLEQEKLTLTQRLFEAERDRDDERRQNEYQLQRFSDDRRRMDEDRQKIEEEKRRMEERTRSMEDERSEVESYKRRYEELQYRQERALEDRTNEERRKAEQQLRETKDALEDEARRFRLEREEWDTERKRLKERLEERERDLSDTRDKLNQRDRELADARDRLAEVRNKVNEKERDLADTRDKVAEKDRDLADLRDKASRMGKDLEEERRKMAMERLAFEQALSRPVVHSATSMGEFYPPSAYVPGVPPGARLSGLDLLPPGGAVYPPPTFPFQAGAGMMQAPPPPGPAFWAQGLPAQGQGFGIQTLGAKLPTGMQDYDVNGVEEDPYFYDSDEACEEARNAAYHLESLSHAANMPAPGFFASLSGKKEDGQAAAAADQPKLFGSQPKTSEIKLTAKTSEVKLTPKTSEVKLTPKTSEVKLTAKSSDMGDRSRQEDKGEESQSPGLNKSQADLQTIKVPSSTQLERPAAQDVGHYTTPESHHSASVYKHERGSWICPNCDLRMSPRASACTACETPKPEFAPLEMAESNSSAVSSFGGPASAVSSGLLADAKTSFASTPSLKSSTASSIGDYHGSRKLEVQVNQAYKAFTSDSESTPESGASSEGWSGTSINVDSAVNDTLNRSNSSSGNLRENAGCLFSAPLFRRSALSNGTGEAAGNQPAAKPLSGFTFGSKPALGENMALVKPTDCKDGERKVFATGKEVTFADVAKSDQIPVTPVRTVQVPSSSTPKSPRTPGEADDSFEPECDFEPVVQLPTDVTLTTGEENELALLAQRCKLYRFDVDQKQWKERGIGEIKILKDKDQDLYRILMRRDQVLKVCANHRLTATTKLSLLQTSPSTVKWFANDFADQQVKQELFAARFKNPEQMDEFSAVFNQAVDALKKGAGAEKQKEDKEVSKPQQKPSLSELFKSKVGEWECATCYVKNRPDSVKCVACETPQPGATVSTRQATEGSHGSLQSTVGSAMPEADCEIVLVDEAKLNQYQLPQSFYKDRPACPGCVGCDPDNFDFDSVGKPRQTAVEGAITVVTANACGDKGNVKYGQEIRAQTAAEEPMSLVTIGRSGDRGNDQYLAQLVQPDSAPDGLGTGLFAASVGSVDFAALAKKGSAGFMSKPDKPVSWAGQGSVLFTKTRTEDSGDEDNVETEAEVHFEPVVQLPEVTVTTGEENEEVLFCDRAKLYRWDNGQWKERGVGQLKILQHKETGKCRILHRREQVYKLACNHYIDPEMKLLPMQGVETALTWSAMDFSEGQSRMEKLAARFKNKEIASQFSQVFDRCRELMKSGPTKAVESIAAPPQTEDRPATPQGEGEEEYVDEELYRKQVTIFHVEDGQPKKIGTGDIAMVPCERLAAYRVTMESKGTTVCDNIISSDLTITSNKKKKVADWTSTDYSDLDHVTVRTFRVQFSSEVALDEFVTRFKEGVNKASEQQLTSESPRILDEYQREGASGYEEEDDDDDEVLWTADVQVQYDVAGRSEEKCPARLTVLNDLDVEGYRLHAVAIANGCPLFNHIICNNYTVQKSTRKLLATWSAKDFATDEPVRRTFRVIFKDTEDLQRFLEYFQKGVDAARDNCITEQPDVSPGEKNAAAEDSN